ncbi:hypothetical protein FGO68_gene11213 [Halteria grandinella]|uniref:Tyrosine-protein phosphatase domain-containing protein n=1 Tax=Halteria grandinella TaxID=5974 RepID=A0A8J8SVU9_HALGN|nr:hypothetical protein FGO68_gene11213 [Halteria grandinella]
MIGAIKIKDGLFIGDEFAAQDLEFVVANKVTHVINCAGKQIPNHWEPIGVSYLTFFWLDQDNQIVLDVKDEASNAIFDFIEEAHSATESVLVHSVRGQSRATCALAAYIMKRYRWSLLKTLEFLNSRRPDLEIRATFIHQLSAYETRLQGQRDAPGITSKWDEISTFDNQGKKTGAKMLENEELVLRNTFVNAQMGPLADFRGHMNDHSL